VEGGRLLPPEVVMGLSTRVTSSSLAPSHPLRLFVEEHETLLRLLDRLERTDHTKLAELEEITRGLLAGEPHHQREERALFPQLEASGAEGPTNVMRIEHEEIRRAKHHLHRLVLQASALEPHDFRERFQTLSSFLIAILRAHINKEDDILYPMALRTLAPEQWQEVEVRSARIGPCHFPEEGVTAGVAR
jgi:uncharacterized protein